VTRQFFPNIYFLAFYRPTHHTYLKRFRQCPNIPEKRSFHEGVLECCISREL
jgi:hypothetical protein